MSTWEASLAHELNDNCLFEVGSIAVTGQTWFEIENQPEG